MVSIVTNPDRQLEKLARSLAKGQARLTFAGSTEPFRIRAIPDSACRVACPAGVNVKAYVGLIAAGMFDRALAVVREKNPLPGICGRVCTHPCESECRRQEIDEPVAIRPLKRFIADYHLRSQPDRRPVVPVVRKERIAVVGSGPAGLTVANDLARLGYQLTIFEAGSQPGGMLRLGIPVFRLPRPIIDREIEDILNLGVRLETNAPIDNPAELLRQGFAAVFYGIGAHASLKLGLDQEATVAGVVDSLSFLRAVATGRQPRLTGPVLVVGGGNSAVDAARTAVRLGAPTVQILYRRTRKELPADPDEISEAEIEGVQLRELVQPVALLHEAGRLTGLRCIRTRLAEPDASGRRRPVPVAGSEFNIPAQLLISAIGQRPETRSAAQSGIAVTATGTVAVDPATGQTTVPGIFAGGDVVTGPATVIDAIAAGHRAARSIHAFITGSQPPDQPGSAPELELAAPLLTAVPVGRATSHKLSARRRKNFAEVEQPLSEAEAVAEAQRCLRCGPCQECVRCHTSCSKRQAVLTLPAATTELFIRISGPDRPDLPATATITRPGVQPLSLLVTPVRFAVHPELCRSCGTCVSACPHQAVTLVDWQAGLKVAAIAPNLCRGCGQCLALCPSGAVHRVPAKRRHPHPVTEIVR